MVFSNKKIQSTHHNRLNLRDTSAEPGNIYGDSNLPTSHHYSNEDIDSDLNDRQEVNTNDVSELPPLETAHVPHNERPARAALNRIKKNNREGLASSQKFGDTAS